MVGIDGGVGEESGVDRRAYRGAGTGLVKGSGMGMDRGPGTGTDRDRDLRAMIGVCPGMGVHTGAGTWAEEGWGRGPEPGGCGEKMV